MGLKSAMIFLISLIVCQYVQSNHLTFNRISENSRNNLDYSNSPKLSRTNYDKQMNSIGITGGNYARIGQFPFMAVISQFLGNMLFRQCDGTIINSRWVLTAGNCIIHGPRPFFVAFGIIDSPNKGYDFLPSPGVSMITTQAFVHPNYRELLDDDIGLLQMPANIPFSIAIQPIRLAYKDKSFANENALALEWRNDHDGRSESKKLKYITVPVIKNTECKRTWSAINDKHICTAPQLERYVCRSGGPLIVTENGRYLQIGIVNSANYGFCINRIPDLFVRVSSYISWIQAVILSKDSQFTTS